MPLHLRPYHPTDDAAVLNVWESSARTAYSFLNESFFFAERNAVATVYLPKADTTVATLNNTIVGFISMLGNEIGGLFVHPDHMRHGVGHALLAHVAASADELTLTVFAENAIGRAFYAKEGFVEVSRSTHADTGRDQIEMRRPRPP